jgi:hypothetical protein
MSAGFLPNTCNDQQCTPYLEHMLAACLEHDFPNIPPGAI